MDAPPTRRRTFGALGLGTHGCAAPATQARPPWIGCDAVEQASNSPRDEAAKARKKGETQLQDLAATRSPLVSSSAVSAKPVVRVCAVATTTLARPAQVSGFDTGCICRDVDKKGACPKS